MENNFDKNIWYTKAADDIPNLFRRFNADTYRGNYELFCREFAYSMIFGNLRIANIQTILNLLGIGRMPNYMFLIQMDNYHRLYPAYPEFNDYPFKTGVVQAIQTRLKMLKVESVVSRFLGHWTIGVFLYVDGNPVTDEKQDIGIKQDFIENTAHEAKPFFDYRREYENYQSAADKPCADEFVKDRVTAIASDLIKYVYEKTDESISVGISDICASHAQFPRAYSECKTALSFAFYNGRRSYEMFDRHKPQPGITKIDLTRVFFTNLVALLDRCDAEACGAVSDEMVGKFRKANIAPITVRLLVARLFCRITDYYTEAGLDQGELSQIAQDSVIEIMNCCFMDEITDIVAGFCARISKLHSGSRLSHDERFRRHVNDCIERHSSDCLFGLGSIAALSNYSPSYFSRLFVRVYGTPFSQYLASYRVERAKRLLLQESMTLHEIARKVGFCSTSYFCSVFRKKTGKSPRQYATEAIMDKLNPAPNPDI